MAFFAAVPALINKAAWGFSTRVALGSSAILKIRNLTERTSSNGFLRVGVGRRNRYAVRVKTMAVVAGLVLTAVLLFIVILLTVPRKPPQDITVRHVGSVQSGNVTTMTFEITNHTAYPYIFFPFEVQIRNGNGWSKFQGFDITKIHLHPTVAPRGVASYTVNVTNVPAGCSVRFSIRPQKVLLGVNGFVRRAELELKGQARGGGISLNPYDRNSQVFGLPTEVVTEGWVEQGPK
jgi:hypothetical protein